MPLVSAMFEMLLFLYTFGLATWLSQFRRKPWSLRFVRNFLANFAVTIALVTASALAAIYSEETNLRMLQVRVAIQNMGLSENTGYPRFGVLIIRILLLFGSTIFGSPHIPQDSKYTSSAYFGV